MGVLKEFLEREPINELNDELYELVDLIEVNAIMFGYDLVRSKSPDYRMFIDHGADAGIDIDVFRNDKMIVRQAHFYSNCNKLNRNVTIEFDKTLSFESCEDFLNAIHKVL